MKEIEQKLFEEIEQAAERIVAASHSAALAAIDRAFKGGRQTKRRVKGSAKSKSKSRPTTLRRSREDIAELEQRFVDIVRADPGQTMSVLAPRMKTTPRELQVPVTRLKAGGRIKTVGQRQFSRYFPLDDTE